MLPTPYTRPDIFVFEKGASPSSSPSFPPFPQSRVSQGYQPTIFAMTSAEEAPMDADAPIYDEVVMADGENLVDEMDEDMMDGENLDQAPATFDEMIDEGNFYGEQPVDLHPTAYDPKQIVDEEPRTEQPSQTSDNPPHPSSAGSSNKPPELSDHVGFRSPPHAQTSDNGNQVQLLGHSAREGDSEGVPGGDYYEGDGGRRGDEHGAGEGEQQQEGEGLGWEDGDHGEGEGEGGYEENRDQGGQEEGVADRTEDHPESNGHEGLNGDEGSHQQQYDPEGSSTLAVQDQQKEEEGQEQEQMLENEGRDASSLRQKQSQDKKDGGPSEQVNEIKIKERSGKEKGKKNGSGDSGDFEIETHQNNTSGSLSGPINQINKVQVIRASDDCASGTQSGSLMHRPEVQKKLLASVEFEDGIARYFGSDGDATDDPQSDEVNRHLDSPHSRLRAPPVLFTYAEETYSLFVPWPGQGPALEGDETESYPVLFDNTREHHLYYLQLESLFDKLHHRYPSFDEEQMEMILSIEILGIQVPEDNVYTREISLYDLDRLQAGCGISDRLHIRLEAAPRMIHRFNTLANFVADHQDQSEGHPDYDLEDNDREEPRPEQGEEDPSAPPNNDGEGEQESSEGGEHTTHEPGDPKDDTSFGDASSEQNTKISISQDGPESDKAGRVRIDRESETVRESKETGDEEPEQQDAEQNGEGLDGAEDGGQEQPSKTDDDDEEYYEPPAEEEVYNDPEFEHSADAGEAHEEVSGIHDYGDEDTEEPERLEGAGEEAWPTENPHSLASSTTLKDHDSSGGAADADLLTETPFSTSLLGTPLGDVDPTRTDPFEGAVAVSDQANKIDPEMAEGAFSTVEPHVDSISSGQDPEGLHHVADASTGTPPVLISDPTAQANLPSTSSSLELLNPKRSREKFEDGNAPPAEDALKRARLDPDQGNLP